MRPYTRGVAYNVALGVAGKIPSAKGASSGTWWTRGPRAFYHLHVRGC